MLDIIIETLSIGELRGVSENIDIAKGSNKLTQTFKEGWKQYKRRKAWRLRSK